MVDAFFMSGEICFFYAHFYGRRYRPLLTELWVLLSRLAILAIFPERGQKVPPLSLFGGEKRSTYNKQRVQGKSYLLEQHLDGDISNAYLAVTLRSIKAAKTSD